MRIIAINQGSEPDADYYHFDITIRISGSDAYKIAQSLRIGKCDITQGETQI